MSEIDETFSSALKTDAGLADPEMPSPPRKFPGDPEAPHGRDEAGAPLAPYGIGKNGRPRIKPAGPGRARTGDEKPRVDDKPDSPGAGKDRDKDTGGGADYAADLNELGMAIWLGASAMRGGKLWFLRFPDTRPYAAVWKQQLPASVAAWNVAAKQNAAVRGYVKKFSGDGSWSWVIGVSVSSISLLAACIEVAKAPAYVRETLADSNDQEMEQFMTAQLAEMGLIPEEAAAA